MKVSLKEGQPFYCFSAQGYQQETEFDTTELKQQRPRREGKHH